MTLVHIPDRFAKEDPPDGEWQAFMSNEEFIWALVNYSHCLGCLINSLTGYCEEWRQSKTFAVKYANKYLPREHHLAVRAKHEHPRNPVDYEIYMKEMETEVDSDA